MRIIANALCVFLVAALMLPMSISAQQRKKLVIMMPGSISGVYPDGVVEGFQEKYPHIDVEVIEGPWGDLSKIPVMAAGGALPDVWYAEAGRASQWGYQGFATDLRPFIERDLDLADFFLLEASSDPQGRIWGVPGGFQMTVLYYMTHMFDAAGLAYPDDSWTIDDLVDNSKKLTRRDANHVSQYGFYTSPTSGTTGWFMWLHLMGGSVLDETMTQSRLNTPEAIKSVEFLQNFMWVDEAHAKYGSESGFDLYSNNLAMQFNIYKRVHDIRSRDIHTFDVAKMPKKLDGERYTTVVPNVWMISHDSPVKEEAWAFLKYYLSEEVQEKVVDHKSEVPVNRHASRSFLSQEAPPHNYEAILDSFAFAETLEENAAWDRWWADIPKELIPAWRNQETAASAMEKAHQRLEAILEDAYGR